MKDYYDKHAVLEYRVGRKYWKTLKMRLNKEGSELVTNCYKLKI